MHKDITPLKQDVQQARSDIADLKQSVQLTHSDIADLKQDVNQLKLHIENVTDKNISILYENYLFAAKRYEETSSKIESMQQDISLLKIGSVPKFV